MHEAAQRYVRHDVVTDPDQHRGWLAGLPRDLPALAAVVRALVVHADRAPAGSVPQARRDAEPRLRRVSSVLAAARALDGRPPVEPRPVAHRVLGHCRTTSVLLCSLLRETGTPARTRCGFSVYYAGGRPFYGDHWVVEHWDERSRRWLLADAELDDETRDEHGITFDPFDVPRDQLLLAGEAWRRGRADGAAWSWFGAQPSGTGQDYVAGQLLRDVACLANEEPSPFDDWAPRPLGGSVQVLDQLAGLTVADADGDRLEEVRRAHPWTRPPAWALAAP